ncbi:PE family domain protein [Mycobacterium kansasii 824]|nr:PE family domain protein [Mycobacterium kansasii 824]
MLNAINAPAEALTGRPLIGNGVNGARAPEPTARPADGCSATADPAGPGRRT